MPNCTGRWPGCSAIRRSAPVSYTHLDVYKRQLCEQDDEEAGKADGIRDEAGEDEHEPAGEQEGAFP